MAVVGLFLDFGAPLDEISMLDHLNCLDANTVEQRDWISSLNIKDCGNDTADVRADFDDAFHVLDFSQTFDGGFDSLTLRFNKVELLLVPGNLFSIAVSIDLGKVILGNKTQNSNRVCFIVQ